MQNMLFKKGLVIGIISIFLLISITTLISGVPLINYSATNIEKIRIKSQYKINDYKGNPGITTENLSTPNVIINIDPYSVVYEGDIINCNITGDPTIKYWQINNQSKHTTFYGNNPIIFDPEPTPIQDLYVNLKVYVENDMGNDSDTVEIMIKRIYFGDIHWHTLFSDGKYNINKMYENAIDDNYLDFVSCSDHAELLSDSEWQSLKKYAIEYYNPGRFTTLLGFEYTGSELTPGGWPWTAFGCEDVSHINFYYRDVYPGAKRYSSFKYYTYDDIFQAMVDEWDMGHLNVGFPHHPLGAVGFPPNLISYTVNWTFLANGMKNPVDRDKVLRGVEVNSKWGTAIGQCYTPGLPWFWPYKKFLNQTDAWVENSMWEWSENNMENRRFVFMSSSDTHRVNRPGSAEFKQERTEESPSGIVAAYAVHNTRNEIWDAMNNCDLYALQLLKIRVNVRFDNQIAYGRGISCESPLKIQVASQSTFPGIDKSKRNMCPHGYSPNELEYPISDIWLIKKDNKKGRPWCKIIGHETPNENTAVVFFEDKYVQPNDFYWVAIRQKGQLLRFNKGQLLRFNNKDDYVAFIGPVFIDNVTSYFPPDKPQRPFGSTNGKIGVEYTYSSSTTDSNGDQIYYWFEWGDGTYSGWIGPFVSSESGSATHRWFIQGDYEIRVKARDSYGLESSWSDPLPVTMSRNKATNNMMFWRFLERFPLLQRLLDFGRGI